MSLGAEGTLSHMDFGFPAVASPDEVTFALRRAQLHNNFLDHKHTRPALAVSDANMRNVAIGIFIAHSASHANDLVARHQNGANWPVVGSAQQYQGSVR